MSLLPCSRPRTTHRGVTLVELLVVLAIMGVMAGVVGLAIPPVQDHNPDSTSLQVASARRTALVSGHPVTAIIVVDGRAHAITARPNGTVLADSEIAVDQLTGEARPRVVPAIPLTR